MTFSFSLLNNLSMSLSLPHASMTCSPRDIGFYPPHPGTAGVVAALPELHGDIRDGRPRAEPSSLPNNEASLLSSDLYSSDFVSDANKMVSVFGGTSSATQRESSPSSAAWNRRSTSAASGGSHEVA